MHACEKKDIYKDSGIGVLKSFINIEGPFASYLGCVTKILDKEFNCYQLFIM